MTGTADAPLKVVVAGGGVAALECVLALRDQAGDRVDIELMAPEDRFTYRPLTVGEPFGLGVARTLGLRDFAAEVGVAFRQAALTSVLADAGAATVTGGDQVVFDALVVAIGARRVPAFEHGITFRGQEDVESIRSLLKDLDAGDARRLAFVVPDPCSWTLPIYELALMTAHRASAYGLTDVELTIVTPEERPLALFGDAGAGITTMLESAGIGLKLGCRADVVTPSTVNLRPGGESLECDRIVALPDIVGIPVDGLPHDAGGFVPVDAHGRAAGNGAVYVAGDGTTFPIKQGGLACQQAVAVASAIAAEAGVSSAPRPFAPVLRGQLRTDSAPHFMRRDLGGHGRVGAGAEHPLWWPPGKIAGEYLGPYLATDGDRHAAAEVAPGVRRRVLISVDPDHSDVFRVTRLASHLQDKRSFS